MLSKVISKFGNLGLPKGLSKNPFLSWVLLSHVSFVFVAFFFVINSHLVTPNIHNKYFVYASNPLTVSDASFQIETQDARSQKIDSVYRAYKCPLEGLGDVMVREADKNNIPWWIVAAISFQESSCGKKIPYVDGEPTYNAWGYAVYGDNVHGFDNWVEGIEVMSRYLSKRFFSQGVTETSDIMKIYTPPSLGSWYKGVDYYSALIQNYSEK